MSQQSHKNKGLFRSSTRNIESSYYQTEMFLGFFFGGKLHNMLMLNWHQSKHFALTFLPNLWLFQRKHCTLMISSTCWWLFFKKKKSNRRSLFCLGVMPLKWDSSFTAIFNNHRRMSGAANPAVARWKQSDGWDKLPVYIRTAKRRTIIWNHIHGQLIFSNWPCASVFDCGSKWEQRTRELPLWKYECIYTRSI